ncbi:MAG TPA: serine hydrolase domain-containing protein [Terriglobales bacterium]|nr:serine hydrolase domain-containing protein [Terriglobales bacterium]
MIKFICRAGWVLLGASCLLAAQNPLPQKNNKEQKPQAAAASTKPVPGETPHELTAADLEAFLDGLVPAQIARDDIGGVVIAVVQNGKVIFEKGYGYADVKTKRPVLPDQTLFRPGSISKLFTWTAVMQLVEEGKIDLDHDINDYLDFKIEPAFGQPITMRNIMTHTPGFEEAIKDLISKKQLPDPLREYLVNHQPRRIYPPGTVPAYSNYGATLAGYVVQHVSGEPFEEYVEKHIYEPLHMQHSTFRQPLPQGWDQNMSSGYQAASSAAKEFEFVNAPPAGSMSTTADDMTHFMIAHLQNGEYQGGHILQAATAEKMHSRTFGAAPDLNGMCLGFYQENRNGHPIIGHGGDTQYFHSDLHLILDANTGFFISQNSLGKPGDSLRETVFHHFLDRYFPYAVPPIPAVTSAKQDAAKLDGSYMSSRRPGPNLLAALNFLGEAKVGSDGTGRVIIDAFKDPNGQAKKFVEVKPNLYREEGGQAQIEFFTDYSGAQAFGVDYPFMIFMKPSVTQTKSFATFSLFGPIIFFALALILWIVGAIIRAHYDRRRVLDDVHRRRHRRLMLAAAIDLLFVVVAISVFSAAGALGLGQKMDPLLRVIQIVAVLAVIATIIPIYNLFRPWWQERWWWNRVYDVMFAVSAVLLAWWIIAWHVLTPSLRF